MLGDKFYALKQCVLTIWLGLSFFFAIAQEDSIKWVETYPDTWSMRTYGIVKAQGLSLINPQGERLDYLPDNIFGIGLGVSYDFINIDLGLTVGGPQSITTRFDFQGNLFFGKSTFDLYLQLYRGFRVVNPENVEPPEQQERRDIQTAAIGVNYIYVFNGDKLSARAVFTGDYRQERSIGSWMVGGFTSFFLMRADSSIVPTGDNRFDEEAQLKEITLNSTGVTAGYSYNHVFPSKFNIFVSVLPGIGINSGNTTSEDIFSPQFAEVYRLQGTLAIGYGNEKFYTALSSATDFYWISLGENRFIYSLIKIKGLIGYRFRRKGN